MKITIDLPAAWIVLPLTDRVVQDPNLEDETPRYPRPPEGGWMPVGDAVLKIYRELQNAIRDPFAPALDVEYELKGDLSTEQERIVSSWFCATEAPSLEPGDTSWLNGRHRSWGLKSAGFDFTPVLLVPLDSAISSWHPELDNGWPFGPAELQSQRRALRLWRTSKAARAWRAANPSVEPRWSTIIERWEKRLTSET